MLPPCLFLYSCHEGFHFHVYLLMFKAYIQCSFCWLTLADVIGVPDVIWLAFRPHCIFFYLISAAMSAILSCKFLEITVLMHFFHVFIYFMSLHVSSVTALVIRRSYSINTSSGMISPCRWLLGIPSSHLHRLIIPDDVLIRFSLLMTSAVTLETCRDMK